MKKHYISPAIEIVNLNTEDLATPTIVIGSGKASGGDAMAKPNTDTFEDEYEDDEEETVDYSHTNLWEYE